MVTLLSGTIRGAFVPNRVSIFFTRNYGNGCRGDHTTFGGKKIKKIRISQS